MSQTLTRTMQDKTTGQRIRYARACAGLTMAAFGEAVAKAEGRDQPYLSGAVNHWEHDRAAPSLATCAAMGEVTSLRAAWIAFRDGNPALPLHTSQGAA